ncbi:MAG: L-histidine N(alpha)-methyltransferase [Gemmatimonadetes bacterium]|nr:L-histidine N(alpha)-methyltransferase [Gemmatimonadota bacterium]
MALDLTARAFTVGSSSVRITRCSPDQDPVHDFARAVVRGLSDRPRWLPCRFLYDAEGSKLFERICDTPEYYLTRTETAILRAYAHAICRLTGAATLVELGSGNARKTELLLEAYGRAHGAVRYVPVDVSEHALYESTSALVARHRQLSIEAVLGTYENALDLFERLSPLVLLFLGSTVGNLNQTEAAAFWTRVSRALAPGDFVLLGADLVKPAPVLDAAYNDAAGWSAAFTRNVFARMNRELGSGIDLGTIEHEAAYREEWGRVEIFARFTQRQIIHLRPLSRSFTVEAGERVMTEISRKFDLRELATYLSTFGLQTVRAFTDATGWYAVILLRRLDDGGSHRSRSVPRPEEPHTARL